SAGFTVATNRGFRRAQLRRPSVREPPSPLTTPLLETLDIAARALLSCRIGHQRRHELGIQRATTAASSLTKRLDRLGRDVAYVDICHGRHVIALISRAVKRHKMSKQAVSVDSSVLLSGSS